MEHKAESPETPDQFLDALGDNLKAKEGLDADLVDILTTYILKTTPAPNAVAQAKEAIQRLAIERGNISKVETTNG